MTANNAALVLGDDGRYRVMLRGLDLDVYLPEGVTEEQAYELKLLLAHVFAKGQDIAQERFMDALRRHFSEHLDAPQQPLQQPV